MSQYTTGPGDVGPVRRDVDINTTIISPFDRVRWGPIMAGLFVALSLIVLLSVLGAAIGLTAYEVGESGRAWGIGSAIWAIIVMIVAFFFGGWIASRSAALRGWPNYGLLQGFLVWAVAVPLFIYFLSGALVNFVGPAAQVATAGGERPIRAFIQPGEQGTTGTVEVRPEHVQAGRRAAWSTLVSLVLGLGAAAAGGYLGTMNRGEGYEGERYRGTRTTPPTMTP